MQVRYFNILLFLLFTVFIFSGCKKGGSEHSGNPGNEGINMPAASAVTGSVTGRIINDQGTAIENALVKIGTTIAITDAKGSFNTPAISMDKYLTSIQISAPGYYTSFRSISGHKGKNYITISLIAKTLAGIFNNNSGGVISLANGTSLTFGANSFLIKNSGAAYNGSVRGFVNYIDPVINGKRSAVCNQLLGTDGNKLFALKSAGMFVAEFETDGGETLQLANGQTADVKLPIPSQLVVGAPSTIETWSLGENGIWNKEGRATKSGNDYRMQVSHFSFWNCDTAFTSVFLDLNIKDQQGNILPNVMVALETLVNTSYGFAADFTDSLGNVSGFVPADESLILYVVSDPWTCNDPLYTQQIGSFSKNTSLNIVASIPSSNLLDITGTVTNCDNLSVTNGTAIISANDYVYYASIINGSFHIVIPHCIPLAQIDVVVIDNNSFQSSAVTHIAVTGNAVNTGSLNACGIDVKSYVKYNFDGTDYEIYGRDNTLIYSNLFIDQEPPSTAVYANGGTNYFSFSVTGYGIGTHLMGDFCHVAVDKLVDVNLTSASSVIFTKYGAVGEYIDGSFDIYFVYDANHHVTGTFHVMRTL